MISVYWEATLGTYHASYSKYEFVHLISGKITITPDGGQPVQVGPGDAFVVEAGVAAQGIFYNFVALEPDMTEDQVLPILSRMEMSIMNTRQENDINGRIGIRVG